MVAFPETEPMTIKRIEVALRNKDLYLLQEATNKLHEKYHTGFEFTMFDELKQIKDYIENSDIPNEITDVLCPTIDSILSSAGHNINEYKIDEEKERQREALKKNYDYNFGDPSSNVTNDINEAQEETYVQEEVQEQQEEQYQEEHFEEPQAQETQENNYGAQQSFDFSNFSQVEPQNYEENNGHVEYQEAQVQENNYVEEQQVNENQYVEPQENNYVQEQIEENNYQEEQPQEEYKEEIQEQIDEEIEEEIEEEKVYDNVAIFYNASSTRDISHEVKEYCQKLNFINSGLYSKQPVNILGKMSSIMDLVDVKDSISDFLYGISDTKCQKTFITTSINQNITNYLANNNVKFQIPMVQNTYSEDSKLDIIPMYGATNLFVCPKCKSMFLNTGSYLKVLNLGCPECNSIAYPSIYDPNGIEGNSIFWQRALSSLIQSKIWIIINPPKIDENEVIMDFLKVAFKSSNPKKVYIYSNDNTYENMINSFNKDTQILSSYESLEALYNDLINNKGIE